MRLALPERMILLEERNTSVPREVPREFRGVLFICVDTLLFLIPLLTLHYHNVLASLGLENRAW